MAATAFIEARPLDTPRAPPWHCGGLLLLLVAHCRTPATVKTDQGSRVWKNSRRALLRATARVSDAHHA